MAGKNFALRTLLVILIGFLFLSCDDFFDLFNVKNDDLSGDFWATNNSTGKDYRVKAELLAPGVYCNVWVEKGSGVSRAKAENFAHEYDNKIYGLMIDVFSIESPSYDGIPFSNIMEVADYLGDGDKKLCILLLDIKDNYKEGVNESYVAGYFWSRDFLDMSGSNKCDMIYIDTYPGMKGENNANVITTLAHEMQHMMNYVTGKILRSQSMDVWIDEGLSSAAEYIVSGKHSSDRIDWYNENGDSKGKIKINGLIDQGNNFFVWGNRKTENKYADLDDYATVYLFFQWLRLQKGNSVYREIISSNFSDYRAIENVMGEEWNILFKNWMAANYINDSTGVYGYKGDISITAHTVPAGKTEVSLYPGEGVYSLTDVNDIMPLQSGKIKYAGLNKTSAQVSDNSIFASGALLTFNINTVKSVSAEKGITTGKAASVNITPMGRSVTPLYSGPYRIGARDLLPESWNEYDFSSWNFQGR